ncbi:hypothetical protein CAP36_16290 [Chitinophagaceae bacterium IBVUCB2]|nr:hypothetical protein CAP36_16290 [Chitinophagaceae bacterium IBVUCB2]
MTKIFNRILVPVNFNRNTELLMKKAVQVANEFNCDLHLLYVQTPISVIPFLYDGSVSGSLFNFSMEDSQIKMQRLQDEYKSHLSNGLLMTTEILHGSWQTIMKEVIISKHIDLVLIPKYHRKFTGALVQQININKLSQQTQCPVLTVTRRFDVTQLHNIVVPVNNFIPIKKLTMATFLARKFNGIVHLMGQKANSKAEEKLNTRCVTKSYQLLRDYTNVRVHCSAEIYSNGHADTLAYAKDVAADLIVVNPGKESMRKGWWGNWFGKYLFRESNIPVLTIAPQQ